ncbi:hypothetical protein AOLI_G00252130 [Acnodon oligacanthus]
MAQGALKLSCFFPFREETDHANLPPGPNQKEGLLHPSSSVSDWLALRPCRCGKRRRACLQCCVERDDFYDGYWEREFMGNLHKAAPSLRT